MMARLRDLLTRVRMHDGATSESLGMARILIFAIWLVYVVQDPIQQLVYLPIELFHPYGVFRLLPEAVWPGVITPTGLLLLKIVLLGIAFWAMVGWRGARAMAVLTIVLGLFYLEIKKGFGGHWDHRELTLVYATFMLALTPAWDALVPRRRPVPARRPGVYQASLILLALIVILQYLFIGAARAFIGGPQVFMNGALQNWIENRNLRPNPFGFDIGTLFLDPFWAPLLDLGLLAGTLLEFAPVLLLFLRPGWLKVLLAFAFVVFHIVIFVTLNVSFAENIVMVLLFFDLAAPLRRLRRGHEAPGTLVFDPANPRAVQLGATVAARTDGRVQAVPADDDRAGVAAAVREAALVNGAAFSVAGSDEIRVGTAARTEVLYRRRGRSGLAWLQERLGGAPRPLPRERSAFAAWFAGPVDESAAEVAAP